MSILNLPEPTNWAGSWRRIALVIAGTYVFVGWFVYLACRAAVRGDYLTAVGLGAFVGFPIVLVTALGFVAGGWTSLRTANDATGTKIHADRIFEWSMYLGVASFTVGATLIAIFLPRGMIDLSVTRGWRLAAPIVLVPAVIFAVRGLYTAYKRGGMGYVRLTPAGLDIASILSNEIAEWDDIVKFTDHSEDKKTRKAAVLTLRDGSEKIIDGLDFYVPGGAPLYWMIRHYWLHPEDRVELVDGRALERMKAGRFDVDESDATTD